VPPIPPLSGTKLASMDCSPENKVSLRGVGRLHVTTPLQRRHTYFQGRNYRNTSLCLWSPLLNDFVPLLVSRYLLIACLPLVGNSSSCTSSEFTFVSSLKIEKRLKIDLAPIHPL
jgi:hypothetical protein